MATEIYNGDCLDWMEYLSERNEFFDLIYCDLPYGTTQCNWDNIIDFKKMWFFIDKLVNINTPIVFHAQQPFTSALIMSRPEMFKYSIVWEKSKATGFLNAKIRPLVAHEDILVFCKGTPVYYPVMSKGEAYNKGLRKEQTTNDVYGKFGQKVIKSDGERYPRSVVYFKTAESEGTTYHKTQKPVALAEYIIKTFTLPNQKVLDFTAGSGTCGVACFNLNRHATLIENNLAALQAIYERIPNLL